MAYLGADPGAMDSTAAFVEQQAAILDNHRSALTARLHQTPWHGQSADNFRRDWDGGYARTLAAAADSLRMAARVLKENANQQREASASGTGRSVAGGFGSGAAVGGPGLPTELALDAAAILAYLDAHGLTVKRVGGGFVIVGGIKFLLDAHHDLRGLNIDSVRNLLSVSKSVAKAAKIGPLDVLSTGWDAGQVGVDLSQDHYRAALWDTGTVGVDVASIAIPEVGAFVLGADIGMYLDHQFHISDHTSSYIQDQSLQRLYGTGADGLTEQQATQFAHRYDGLGGAVNYVQDTYFAVPAPVRDASAFLAMI